MSSRETTVPSDESSASSVADLITFSPKNTQEVAGNEFDMQEAGSVKSENPRRQQHGGQEVDYLPYLRTISKNYEKVLNENREVKSSLQDFHRSKEEVEKQLRNEKDALLEEKSKRIQQIHEITLNSEKMFNEIKKFEKTNTLIIEEQKKDKILTEEKLKKLTLERDQALNRLSNMEMEISILKEFKNLLADYEKCKSDLMIAKERERDFNLKIFDYEAKLRYKNLMKGMGDNLDKANETKENIKKSHNVEIAKLYAIIKRQEIMIQQTTHTAQDSLSQIKKDNEEMMRLYKQFIYEAL